MPQLSPMNYLALFALFMLLLLTSGVKIHFYPCEKLSSLALAKATPPPGHISMEFPL